MSSLLRIYSAPREHRARFRAITEQFHSDRFPVGASADLAFAAAIRRAGLARAVRHVDVLSASPGDLEGVDSLYLDVELDRDGSKVEVETDGCHAFVQRSPIQIHPQSSRKLDIMQLAHIRPLYVVSERMAKVVSSLGTSGFRLVECQPWTPAGRSQSRKGKVPFLQLQFEHVVDPPEMPSWVKLDGRQCRTCGRYDVPSLYGSIYPSRLGSNLFGIVDRVRIKGREHAVQVPRPLVSGRVLAAIRAANLRGVRAAFTGVRYSACLLESEPRQSRPN